MESQWGTREETIMDYFEHMVARHCLEGSGANKKKLRRSEREDGDGDRERERERERDVGVRACVRACVCEGRGEKKGQEAQC